MYCFYIFVEGVGALYAFHQATKNYDPSAYVEPEYKGGDWKASFFDIFSQTCFCAVAGRRDANINY